MIEDFQHQLAELDAENLRRERRTLESACGPIARVEGRELLSFCSNDYLGLASEPALIEAACEGARRYGVGAGASHLVSGHGAAHEALELALARFVGLPRALYFSTGYMANVGVVPALVGRGDAIFADRLNHACLVDGALLSRADHHRYRHGDVAALARLLECSRARRKLVASDAVFSMDGDFAPLTEILDLCERHDALLLVDDAHGFGVLGDGRGTLAELGIDSPRVIYMGTLGKAAGVAGAFVAGQADLIEWVMQRARTYIFTTASPPMIAHALLRALELVAAGDDRRAHLRALIARFREGVAASGWRLMASHTAIQPILIGEAAQTLAISKALWARGLWVPAIRPPTVPAGQSRLRVSLTAAHSFEQVDRLVAALRELA